MQHFYNGRQGKIASVRILGNVSVIIGPATARRVGPVLLALVWLCSTSLIQMVTPFLCVWLWFNLGVDRVIMTLQIHTYHMYQDFL